MISPYLWCSYEKSWSCSEFISFFSSRCLSIFISVPSLTSSLSLDPGSTEDLSLITSCLSYPIASFTVFINPHSAVRKIHSRAIITLPETAINYAHNIPSSITFFSFFILSTAFSKLIFYHSKLHRVCFLLPLHHTFSLFLSYSSIFYSYHKLQSNWKFIFYHMTCIETKQRRFQSKRHIYNISMPHYKASCHPQHWLEIVPQNK